MGTLGLVAYVAALIALMYFMVFRPQSKQRKEHEALIASVEVGDAIETSSGFYGVIIDITDDMVIVEFGQNKNCRIPMSRQAIVNVEKPNQG